MQETGRTGQQQGRGTWLTIHQKRRKINQLKKALKDLVVFTDHHRGRTRRHPQPIPLQLSLLCHHTWIFVRM